MSSSHLSMSMIKMPEYRPDAHFPVLIPPYTVLLKDGETTATIYPIHNYDQLPPGLLAFLADEFNMEVDRGDTFPFFDTLDIDEFKEYWFGAFAAVMVLGDDAQLDHPRQWEKECLGTFFIRANFPGRSSHISTGGFLVNAGIRGKGIGRTLVECYLDWAPKLGYTSSLFNLIFETNVGARRIFESLNFKRVGKIKAAGILKEHETAVDAIIYGKELVHPVESTQVTYRFDKIKYYLETGKYPPLIDRQEKSRLRSSASHYKLIDGKLTLNGKEVISDPVRQLEICSEYHRVNHGGINKTTSAITDRYHWTRIKDTVAQAIRNCNECRDPSKAIKRKKESPPHMEKSHSSNEHLDHLHHQQHQHHNANNNNGASDYDAIVNAASSHLHRSDTNLLPADLSSLDDPSGILAAVEDAQRRSQLQQQQQHHHHQHQSQQHQHHQQLQHSHHQQQHQLHHDQQYASQLKSQSQQHHHQQHGLEDQDQQRDQHQHQHQHHPHHSHQHRKEQQQDKQSSYTNQYSQAQDRGRYDNAHDEIPVDPEVSAFDEQGQNGEEIEIARALIQANEDPNEADNDEVLFR